MVAHKLHNSNQSARLLASAALAVAATLTIASAMSPEAAAQANRFAGAKKTIVPASRFTRRYDDESVSTPSRRPTPTPATSAASGTTNAQGLSAGQALTGSWNGKTALQTHDKDLSVLTKVRAKVQPLLATGKFDTAQNLVGSYVKAYPNDKELKTEFAKVAVRNSEHHLKQGLNQAAASAAREALNADPGYQPARGALSQALVKLKVDPANGHERLKLAEGLLSQGRLSEAAVEYSESLRFNPSAEAHIGLGETEWRQEKLDAAKVEFQRALEVNPRSTVALRQLGTLRLKEGDIVGANSDLSKALMINPADKSAATQLVGLWRSQVSQSPDSANGHLGLARAYQLSGDLSAAQSEYREVVRIDPTNDKLAQARLSFKGALAHQQAKTSFDAAHTLETAGKLTEAHQKALEAVALYPSNTEMRMYEAHLSSKLGHTAEARQGYMDAVKNNPTSLISSPVPTANLDAAPIPVASSVPAALQAPANPFAASTSPDLPPLAPKVIPAPGQLSATLPPMQPDMAPQLLPPIGAAQSAVPTQVASAPMGATPGSVIAPYSNPDGMGKAYGTSQQIGAMGSFLSQVLGVTGPQTATPSAATGSGVSTLINSAGAAAAAPVPAVDTSGASGALAQAAAALKAAGAPSSTTATTAAAIAPAASSTASAAPTELTAVAASAFPSVMNGPNSATVTQLIQQYGPMLQSLAATMSPAQLEGLYKQFRPAAEQRLNTQLPPEMPPELRAYALGGSAAGVGAAIAAPPSAGWTPPTAPQMMAQPVASQSATAALLPQDEPPDVVPSAVAPMTVSSAPVPSGQAAASAPVSPSADLPEGALRGPLSKTGVPLAPTVGTAPVATPASSGDELRGFLAPGSSNTTSVVQPIKLELVGVKPGSSETQLKVRLRNTQSQPFKVPSGIKAVVSMNGKESGGKVSFSGDTVPAHGELFGTIKVSGKDLNPSADLWIPNVLPGTGTERNLHLSVSMPSSSL